MKKEQSSKVRRLKNYMRELSKNEMVRMWLAYESLPKHERDRIKNDWDKYVSLSLNTKSAKRYRKMADLLHNDKILTMRMFATKAREQIDNSEWELPTPEGIDPYEFFNSTAIQTYQNIKDYLVNEGDLGENEIDFL